MFCQCSKNHKKSENGFRRSHFDAYNLHLLSLNVLQICKTRSTLNFGKFQTGQFDFELIPFRKKIKNEGPISWFHPLIIKTNCSCRVLVCWGPSLRSKKHINMFNLILGESIEIQVWAIF